MQDLFIIRGGKPLKGTVDIKGSKNAATKMLIASLLTEEPCVIKNTPLSEDLEITVELCKTIGSRVEIKNSICRIETPEILRPLVPKLSRRNRIPILALGPLLHRKGVAEIPVLGGCPIGHRPINFHIEALNKMGARIERREKSYYAEAKELHGTDIELPFPSVGATENIILTAVLAKGKTNIKNAAVEPEILNLMDMLLQMGADISCEAPARKIKISGVKKLNGTTAQVMPDRNEIISFAIAALATEGDIFMPGISQEMNFKCGKENVGYLEMFLKKVKEAGGRFETKSAGLRFFGKKPYQAVFIETSPHPGFMTDWQQPFGVLLTQAFGESIIHETVYEDRFGYTKDLNRMGADIKISDECPKNHKCRYAGQTFNHAAKITGPTPLSGAKIKMTDIRAGMAHIIAALTARNESKISGVEHIDRGYEKIEERLKKLGADIERKT